MRAHKCSAAPSNIFSPHYYSPMKTWIILIRGINVGGNNIVPMKELKLRLTDAGFSGVRTYIQSGNVAFESDITKQAQICSDVQACIDTHFGFAPKIMALSASRLAKIIKDNPFPGAVDEPKTLHISFLARPAINADLEKIENLRTENERFVLTDYAAYAHLPDGVWKSKLAAGLEKHLGVPATARNWRSAGKVLELAKAKV